MDVDDYCYGYEEEDEEDERNDYYDELDLAPIKPTTLLRLKSQSSMIFFRLDDIKRVLDKKIEELQELLDTEYDQTLILFHYFHWNRDKLENSDWFSHQEELGKKAGLIPELELKENEVIKGECPVCMGDCDKDELEALKCGHMICKMCWNQYINNQVENKENSFFGPVRAKLMGGTAPLLLRIHLIENI